MSSFSVPVRNEFTGEVREVEVETEYWRDAQIAALSHLFREHGWRKATALTPASSTEAA